MECRTSRLTDLRFSQLLLPGSEGQERLHSLLHPPNMLQPVHTQVCLRNPQPLNSAGWAQALLCTSLAELLSQLRAPGAHLSFSILHKPQLRAEPGQSPLSLLLLLPRQESGEQQAAHRKAGHCSTAAVAVSAPTPPQDSCVLARGGTMKVPWQKQGTVW